MYFFCFCFYPFVWIKKVVSRYRISNKKNTYIYIYVSNRCRRCARATGKQTGSTFLINVRNFTNLLMETYDEVLKTCASPSRQTLSRNPQKPLLHQFVFVRLPAGFKRSFDDPPPLPFTLVSSCAVLWT